MFEQSSNSAPNAVTDTVRQPSHLTQARRVLEALDPSTQEFQFECYSEKGRPKRQPYTPYGTLDAFGEALRSENQQGKAVYFKVNASDGVGLGNAHVTRVRAVFAEYDKDKHPTASKPFPLTPSIVVESSPGNKHFYWLVADEMPFESFEAIEARLVADFDADPAAVTLKQVLRLPGFFNNKAKYGTPRPVKLLDVNSKRYMATELLAAFCPCVPEKTPPTPRSAERQVHPSDNRPSLERVKSALAAISADAEYDKWAMHVGAALHHWAAGGEEGFELWDTWSAGAAGLYPGATELRAKWKSFGKQKRRPKTIASLFKLAKQYSWKPECTISWPATADNKRPLPNSQRNVAYFLQHLLQVGVSKNTFAGTLHIRGLESFDELTDEAVDCLWARAQELGLATRHDAFTRLVRVIAAERSFHPVNDYLREQRWDGVHRLNTWLTRYMGADDTELNRAFGRLALVAAVRRVQNPGCKFDAMLVLEGPQGAGKSSVAEILGGPWYGTLELGLGAKEVIELTRGRWIVEVPELSGLAGREVEHVKSMVTQTTDRARLAYGRTTTEVKRQFVMIGSTNDDRYLRDRTGNRRFWPIKVGQIDLEALRRDRDQLWTEAKVMADSQMALSLPSHLWREAAQAQGERLVSDPIEERLTELLGDQREGFIPTEELWQSLRFPSHMQHHRTQRVQEVIARTLRMLGWQHTRQTRGTTRPYGYSKRTSETELDRWGRLPLLEYCHAASAFVRAKSRLAEG